MPKEAAELREAAREADERKAAAGAPPPSRLPPKSRIREEAAREIAGGKLQRSAPPLSRRLPNGCVRMRGRSRGRQVDILSSEGGQDFLPLEVTPSLLGATAEK